MTTKSHIGSRRYGREWALQFLFQSEFYQEEPTDPTADPLEAALKSFWENHDEERIHDHKSKFSIEKESPHRLQQIHAEGKKFAEQLIRGVLQHHQAIDDLISKYTEHWTVDRLGTVDRNAIRIAVFEMLYLDDIPPAVSINEAVDVAKLFSSRESGKFVNGVLDKIHLSEIKKAARKDAGQASPTEGA